MAQRKLTPLQRMALATAYSGAYELRDIRTWRNGAQYLMRAVWALIPDRDITPQLRALRKRKLLKWRVDTTTNTIKIELSDDGIEELDKWI